MEIFTSKTNTPELVWKMATLLPPEVDIDNLKISDYLCDSLGGFQSSTNYRINGSGFQVGAPASAYGRPCTEFRNDAGQLCYVPKFDREMFGLYPDSKNESEFAAGSIALSRSGRAGVPTIHKDAYKYVTYDPSRMIEYKNYKLFMSVSFPSGIRILKDMIFWISLVGKAKDYFPALSAYVLNKKGGDWDKEEDVADIGTISGSNAEAFNFKLPAEVNQCWGIRITCQVTNSINRGVWTLFFPSDASTEVIEPVPDLPADLQLVSTNVESGHNIITNVPVKWLSDGVLGYMYASIPVSVGIKKPDTYFIPVATAKKAPMVMSNIQSLYNNGCAKLEIDK